MISITHITDEIGHRLPPKRLAHTTRVRDTTLSIAKAWLADGRASAIDLQNLEAAALLHDIAKVKNGSLDNLHMLGSMTLGRELLPFPKLAHAPIGAYVAQHHFGLEDSASLMGIAYHPTGHPGLDPAGRAIYLADYLEPGRPFHEDDDLSRLMDMAVNDPIACLLEINRRKQERVTAKGGDPHPLSFAFEEKLILELETRDEEGEAGGLEYGT